MRREKMDDAWEKGRREKRRGELEDGKERGTQTKKKDEGQNIK